MKESTTYALKLKMLLLFGLLTIVLISGVTVVIAETMPQQQEISSYSRSTDVVKFDLKKDSCLKGS